MADWREGSFLDPKAWADEARYIQFLASYYGDWLIGLGARATETFGTSALRKWWVDNGKPVNATAFKSELEKSRIATKGSIPLWQDPEKQTAELTDVSKPPSWQPSEGKEWEWVTTDPSTQLPIEPHWEARSTTALEPFDPLAMTDAQKAQTALNERQFALSEREFDWRQQQDQSQQALQQQALDREERLRQMDLQAQALNVQWQNIWRMMSSPQTAGDLATMERERDEYAWQENWAERMSSATNWVDRQNLELERQQHQPVGTGSEKTLDEYRDEVEVEYLKAVKAEKVINEQIKNPNDPLYGDDQAVREIRNWKAAAGRQLNEVDIQQAKLFAKNYPGGQAVESSVMPAQQYGVKSSGFLRERVNNLGEFIPGTGNIGGTAPKVRTPSMYWWRTAPQTQKEELAGYAKFTGEDFSDIYSRTTSMLPQGLNLGRDWRAVSQ